MLPPAPAASIEFGSPNACIACHDDRDASWAERWVRRWYPRDYQQPRLVRARLVGQARKSNWRRLSDTLEYVADPASNPIFVTSLIRLLQGCDDPSKWKALERAARYGSPLVRSAAVEALGKSRETKVAAMLVAALRDSSRLVRVRAAAALGSVAEDSLGPVDRRALAAANEEYIATLVARPDDPASHADLGNYLLDRGEGRRAADAFEIALRFVPENLAAHVNAGLAWNLAGRNDLSEMHLRTAVRLDPRNEPALFNLGLLLAEIEKKTEAERVLRRCLTLYPRNAGAAYNLAILVSPERLGEAIALCRMAVSVKSEEARYAHTLALLLVQDGRHAEAIAILERLLKADPGNAEAKLLLEETIEGIKMRR